jgi:gas vesicle protein
MMRMIRFLAGFIIGMALGGALAVLFTPQPGTETREHLRGRVDTILEEGRQAAERTRAEAHARLAELKANQ